MDVEEKELRTEKVSVMLTPSLRDRLDTLARERKGRASMSSAAADILEAFFASDKCKSIDTQYENTERNHKTPRQTA